MEGIMIGESRVVHRRLHMVVVLGALVVALQSRGATASVAAPTIDDSGLPDPLGQGLVVRVSDDVPEGETIRGWVEARGREVLERRRIALGSTDLIRVAVRGSTYDYRIKLQVRRNGRNLPEQPDPVICACGSEEMLVQVGAAIDAAAEQLAVAAAAERAAKQSAAAASEHDVVRVATPETEATVADEDTARGTAQMRRADGRDERFVRSDRYRPTAVGVAGLAVLSTGAALLAGGIGMTASERSSEERLSQGGLALVGIGSTTVLTGMTMMLVDVVRCRRVPDRCRGHRGEAGARRSAGRWSRPALAGRP
jgi:hypothetical protein